MAKEHGGEGRGIAALMTGAAPYFSQYVITAFGRLIAHCRVNL